MTLAENQAKAAKGLDMTKFRARALVLICWQDRSRQSMCSRSLTDTLNCSPAMGIGANKTPSCEIAVSVAVVGCVSGFWPKDCLEV